MFTSFSGPLYNPYYGIPCNATETPSECLSTAAVFGILAGVAAIVCTAGLIMHCLNKYSTHSNSSTTEKTKLIAAEIL